MAQNATTQWKDSFAQGQVSSLGNMKHTSGDKDTFSKSGRHTNVTLKVYRLRISDDGTAWLADVYYQVKEGRKDYTAFDFTRTVQLPIPQDARKGTSFITNARDYDRSWAVYGERHEVMDVPYTEGTPISSGTYRVDGKGNDQGTVFVDLILSLPFRYLDTVP